MWHWLVVLSAVLFMSCDDGVEEPEPEPSGGGTETEQTGTDEQQTPTDEEQTPQPDEQTETLDEVTVDGSGEPTEPMGDQPEVSLHDQVGLDLEALSWSIAAFFERQSRFPSNLDELTQSIDGSEPIIPNVPNDPWGNPYRFEAQANAFYLTSAGPDTVFDTDDDVTSVLAID